MCDPLAQVIDCRDHDVLVASYDSIGILADIVKLIGEAKAGDNEQMRIRDGGPGALGGFLHAALDQLCDFLQAAFLARVAADEIFAAVKLDSNFRHDFTL